MLSEALDFPTSGERGSAALLVGSLALLLSAGALVAGGVFPFLLVGVLALQVVARGYYVRVLRVTVVDRSAVAPGFDDVERLLRDGLGAVVVSVVYFLPSLLLFSVAAGGNLASAVNNPLRLRDPTTIAAAETVGSLAALLGLFTVLAALYLIPGAVTLYAHENRLRSAFALRRVARGTLSEDYAVGWVVTVLLQAFLLPIVLFLYSLLVGAFLHFFLAVAVRYVWGVSVGSALDIEPPAVDREGITPEQGVDPIAPSVAVAPDGDPATEPTESRASPSTEPTEPRATPPTDPTEPRATDAETSNASAAGSPAETVDSRPANDAATGEAPPEDLAASAEPADEPEPRKRPEDDAPETPGPAGGAEPVEDDGESDGSTGNRSRDPMEDESNR